LTALDLVAERLQEAMDPLRRAARQRHQNAVGALSLLTDAAFAVEDVRPMVRAAISVARGPNR
jgi:hypothetical protein